MAFFQDPPQLGNQYDDDALVREYVERRFTDSARAEIEPELRALGEASGGALYELQLEDRLNEPELVQWDAWGNRVDEIRLTPLWERARRMTAEHGLVATAYEGQYGALSRVLMFVKNYVVQASMDVYSCPLAMTDGAARTLLEHQNQALIDRAVPKLTSRDPDVAWTSGQWMTERTGGSDVGISETVATQVDGAWALSGTKWFTSATTSEMALTLGRPEGAPDGGRGLALFYLETRDDAGRLNGIRINRLKDKLGTRKVPTAELTLEKARAIPVNGLDSGVRNITPMLNVTRTWNAVASAWGMRRGVALARDYADRRRAFGALLRDKPLHRDTVAWMQSELEGGFLLAFRAVELLGRMEAKEASEQELQLLRILTPIVKMTTAKQAVQVASETLECFGGAGYVEDTGLPRLLADAQVLPIWEGTSNVLAMDTLRALSKGDTKEALEVELRRALSAVEVPELKPVVELCANTLEAAASWLTSAMSNVSELEAGARRFALTLGRTLELAYLAEHASWCSAHNKSSRSVHAALRFMESDVNQMRAVDPTGSELLATGEG